MNQIGVVLIVCLALGSSINCNNVLELKDSDFDYKIKEYSTALVKFYAPWCGHCKRLAPDFDKASISLAKNDPPIQLIKVDCTVETKVCGKYEVNGYPTLKIFKDGQVSSEYNGPRDADGIVKYMKTKAGPVTRELQTQDDLNKFLSNTEHSIVGYFTGEESDLYQEYKKVADQLSEKFRFAHTFQASLLNTHKNKIVLYQPARLQNAKLEPIEQVYDGSVSLFKIKSFIEDKIHGLVGHRTTSNQQEFKRPLIIVYFNVDYVKDTKGTNYVRNRVIKLAQKLVNDEKLNIRFAISNSEDFRQELTEHGIENIDVSAKYVLGKGLNGEKYVMRDVEYSIDNLEKFARDLVDNKLEAYLKSEAIPQSNDEPVKILVAKNFNQIVNDETKDVLVEFYAPWCGHCKTLAPKYDELAKQLSKESDLVIAKMDATANDIPSSLYDVKGFPSLYFVPKNAKNAPRKYEGGREIDDFIKYLAKESTNPLVGYNRDGTKKKKASTAEL